MSKNLIPRIIILFNLLKIRSLHINILFALLRLFGHVTYLNVMQEVMLDTSDGKSRLRRK